MARPKRVRGGSKRAFVGFTGKVTGASSVKKAINKYKSIPIIIFGSQRLEKLLLRRTLDRFAPSGSNRRAQRDPTGKPWKRPADATMLRRGRGSTKGRGNKKGNQALVNTRTLLKSIAIIRARMGASVLRTATGGGFRIGVKPGTGADKYARLQQFGGRTGWNHNTAVPARRYLGVGPEDVKAVDKMVQRLLLSRGL